MAVIVGLLILLLAGGATAAGPSVIIVGAGLSGLSAAKTLSDAGVTDITILEATNRIGGRMHKTNFAGLNVELGANWVEGVNGKEVNPIWTIANQLRLRNFYSDFSNLSSNAYKQEGGLYDSKVTEQAIDVSDKVSSAGEKLSASMPPSGREDISVLTLQRLQNQ